MKWANYRELCDRGDVLSRYLLDCTIDLLSGADEALLAQRLTEVLSEQPLPKPLDHRAGAAADFFVVTIEVEAAQRIVEVVVAAREAGWRTASGRGLGGFEEAWQEYVDWHSGAHPRSPHARSGG